MSSRDREIVRALVFGAISLVALGAFGGQPRVLGKHPTRAVPEGRGDYLEFGPQEMLEVQIEGPTHLGLRFRAIVGERPPAPIDLTVVRDDQEQATVRFSLPAGLPGSGVSGEILVKVEVPAGRHMYRLLASGAVRGFAIQPFAGAIRRKKDTIVATPGGSPSVSPGNPPPNSPRKAAPRNPPPLVSPVPAILESVPLGALAEGEIQLTAIARADDAAFRFGPWSRAGLAATSALLFVSTGILLAARVDYARADAEPVQIQAARYFERAENTQTAGAALFAVTCAVAAASVTALFLENP